MTDKSLKETSKQIHNQMESDRIAGALEDYPKTYIVIPRRDIDKMDLDWKDVFLDVMDYLPTLKDNYSVRERGDNGKFIAGEG